MEGDYNITLAFLQSILISLLAYVLIAISETDMSSNNIRSIWKNN